MRWSTGAEARHLDRAHVLAVGQQRPPQPKEDLSIFVVTDDVSQPVRGRLLNGFKDGRCRCGYRLCLWEITSWKQLLLTAARGERNAKLEASCNRLRDAHLEAVN